MRRRRSPPVLNSPGAHTAIPATRSFTSQPSPESLHPGPDTVLSAVSGNPSARAILDSYAFRFPVTIVEVLA